VHVSDRWDSSDGLASVPDDVLGVYSSIYHEIANIITPASLYLNMAKRKNDDGEVEKLIAGAEKQVEQLQGVLKRFREFYRPSPPTPETTSVAAIVSSALAELDGRETGGVAKPAQEGLDLDVSVDPQAFKRVLVEVLANGWEAMAKADEKRWSVSAERLDGATVVRVTDNGGGVATEIVPDPFVPFATTKPVRGSGLGLPIAGSIMATLGGGITIESEAGSGTTASLRLPDPPSSSR